MMFLPLLLAAAAAPMNEPNMPPVAALATPGHALDRQINAWRTVVQDHANRAYASGEFRADAAAADGNHHPYEAADSLRVAHNAAAFRANGMVMNDPQVVQHIARAKGLASRADSIYHGVRADAATEGGMFLARDLEAVWAGVLSEDRPPLQGPSLFPKDTSAGPGQETLSIRRMLDRASAQIYTGGNIPAETGSMRQVELRVSFRHIVSAAAWTVFDQLAFQAARVNGVQRSLANCRYAIESLWDKIIWEGSVIHGLYGVLNYPYLNRRIVQTTFSTSADIDAMIREMLGLVSYTNENSNGAVFSDKMLIAPKLYNFLLGQRLSNVSGESLLDYLKRQAQSLYESMGGTGKYEILQVARLNDAGGTGVHGVLTYKNQRDYITIPVSQPMTLLPLTQTGFQFNQVAYMTMAGVVMPNAYANLLGLVTLSS